MTYEPSNQPETYPDHQLVPLKGGRYTTILHGPEGTDIGDLHCDLEPYMEGGRPAVLSHSGWLPNEQQLQMLAAGAHVRLGVFQHPIPPLMVAVEPPICECHSEEMVWDADDQGYFCAHIQSAAPVTDPLEQAHSDFKPEDDQ